MGAANQGIIIKQRMPQFYICQQSKPGLWLSQTGYPCFVIVTLLYLRWMLERIEHVVKGALEQELLLAFQVWGWKSSSVSRLA